MLTLTAQQHATRFTPRHRVAPASGLADRGGLAARTRGEHGGQAEAPAHVSKVEHARRLRGPARLLIAEEATCAPTDVRGRRGLFWVAVGPRFTASRG